MESKIMESKIAELVDKYDVEIELKYKKDSIIAIINSGDYDLKIIKCGFLNNLIEEIEIISKEMYKNKMEKDNLLTERLNNLDKDIFPDNLFKK